MTKILRNIAIIFTLFILIIIGVQAVPGIPNVFYGDVTVNGQPAADGLLITAKIDGITLARSETLNGSYGANALTVPADNPSTSLKEGGVAGDVIEFYVDGVLAGSHEFNNGDIVELDLFASVDDTNSEASGTTGTSSGSSGGSGSSGRSSGSSGSITGDDNTPIEPISEESPDMPPEAPGVKVIKKPVVVDESGLDNNLDNNDITGNVVSDAQAGGIGLSGLTIAVIVIAIVLVAAFLFRRKVM